MANNTYLGNVLDITENKAEAISGAATEDSVPNEGKITYDIRFHVITPTQERVKMFINVEAQKKYHVGYDLVTRAIFYCARMLSAQLDTEFTADNYDDIKKVYSIWICMDVPQYAENTITEYSIEQKNLFGDFRGKARYDLLSAIMVCIGRTSETQDASPLHKLLATVLSEELPVNVKSKVLQEEYDIHTKKMEEELDNMCNLSDLIEERGIERGMKKGLEQGLEQGLEAMILDNLEENVSIERIAQKLQKYFGLEENEAMQYIEQYGNLQVR